jgi:hypothetical protein
MEKNWTSNETADEVVSSIQESKAPSQQMIQKLLDLVSGVPSYKISNQMRQGVIKRAFERECRKAGPTGIDYSNFSVSFDDVISTFWEAVFAHLPLAKTRGSTVSTRVVKGQPETDRQTNCNAVNWLRMHGIMGVRNAINKVYAKNLIQVCNDCGHRAKATSKESNTKSCPECLSVNTIEFWPSRSSTYKSVKERKCNDCGKTWKRKFTYACAKCLSVNVHIESIFDNKDDLVYEVSVDTTVEDEHINMEMELESQKLISGLYNTLPLNPDPNSDRANTKSREILDIIFKPEISKDICAKCTLNCGADSFSMDKCTNYSKRIGEYQGVSATLSFRRIKTIRNCFIKYVTENQSNDLCASTYAKMVDQGRIP